MTSTSPGVLLAVRPCPRPRKGRLFAHESCSPSPLSPASSPPPLQGVRAAASLSRTVPEALRSSEALVALCALLAMPPPEAAATAGADAIAAAACEALGGALLAAGGGSPGERRRAMWEVVSASLPGRLLLRAEGAGEGGGCSLHALRLAAAVAERYGPLGLAAALEGEGERWAAALAAAAEVAVAEESAGSVRPRPPLGSGFRALGFGLIPRA
mmetsp:Transcript_33305/g.106266  ORF Transcript_33305/g.106266 Transcript_33305/m.106266 type:complete len:214 (+) Transcript_33305:430-1071(+)